MKPLHLTIAAVIALFLAGSPYFFGMKAEEEYRSLAEQYNGLNGISIEITDYKRGWLSSQVRTRMTLESLAADPELAGLENYLATSTIHHGPLPLANKYKGNSAPLIALAVMETTLTLEKEPTNYKFISGETPLMTSQATVSFSGEMVGVATAEKIEFTDPDKSFTLNWKGFTATTNLADNKIKMSIEGDGLEITVDNGKFTLLGYRSDSDHRFHETGSFLGTTETTLTGLNFVEEGENPFFMKEATLATSTDAEENLLATTLDLTFKELGNEEDLFGPFKISTAIKNIDMSASQELQEAINSAAQGLGLDTPPSKALNDAFLKLVKASPALEIPTFSLGTKMGLIEGNFNLSFDGAVPFNIEDPATLAAVVKADLLLTLPRTIALAIEEGQARSKAVSRLMGGDLEKIPPKAEIDALAKEMAEQALEMKIMMGYLNKMEGDLLRTEANFNKGALTINGRQLM